MLGIILIKTNKNTILNYNTTNIKTAIQNANKSQLLHEWGLAELFFRKVEKYDKN